MGNFCNCFLKSNFVPTTLLNLLLQHISLHINVFIPQINQDEHTDRKGEKLLIWMADSKLTKRPNQEESHPLS